MFHGRGRESECGGGSAPSWNTQWMQGVRMDHDNGGRKVNVTSIDLFITSVKGSFIFQANQPFVSEIDLKAGAAVRA